MTINEKVAETLAELAERCERLALEQTEYAVSDGMPHEAAQEYASLATNLWACATAIKARAQAKDRCDER